MNEQRVFGSDPMMPRGMAWGAGARVSRRSRGVAVRAGSALAWALGGVVAGGVYTNVLADDSALRERVEHLARSHAGCDARCHVAKMQSRRTVLEYRADFEVDGVGEVQVLCRRAAIVVGDYRCEVR